MIWTTTTTTIENRKNEEKKNKTRKKRARERAIFCVYVIYLITFSGSLGLDRKDIYLSAIICNVLNRLLAFCRLCRCLCPSICTGTTIKYGETRRLSSTSISGTHTHNREHASAYTEFRIPVCHPP